jgi:DNA-binding transcriptional ArsR family regulator
MKEKSSRTVTSPDIPEDLFRTAGCPGDLDPLDELSEYLDVLSNSTRLKILRCLEKKPKTTRELSREVRSSYQNTKKHLDLLCMIGVIKKEAGITDPLQKGVQLYWKYTLVPGGLESVIRNLGIFSHMKMHIISDGVSKKIDETRRKLSCELLTSDPVLLVLGGQDDGMAFSLKSAIVRIGRADPENHAPATPHEALVLSQRYSAVSRVSRPHARLYLDEKTWYIEDCGSSGGTFVNKKNCGRCERIALHDGDLIELSKGTAGAKLLLIIPAVS